jgi:hypothetical protein
MPACFNDSIEDKFREVVLPVKGFSNFTEGVSLSIKQVVIPALPRYKAIKAPETPPPTIVT